MTRKFRMLLLGAASLVTLAFAGVASAAFNPTLAIGHTPPTAGSTTTSFRLTVPRDDDALFKASFYVPAGYTATLGQAPGTQIGTVAAQVQVREPIAGAVLPLTGTVVVTDQATVAAQVGPCTGTTTHAAYWVLVLQAAGQELRVPMVIDPAPAPLAAVASYVLAVCLPSPHIPVAAGGATFGAKLIQAQLNLNNVLRAPASGGTYRWHVVTTPWPNGPGMPNAAGTVTAQGTAALPGAISVSAKSKKRVLTITGRLTEGGQGIGARTVTLRVGTKNYSVRTNASGTFRKVVRIAKGSRVTIRATAAVPSRTGACTATSPFAPRPCVSDTSQFFTAMRSIVARVR
ncbi:MAG: hypothetical protein H0T20_09725 [Actinobacteria bacterium]|nr:hypothetical protein [Actinomycetota bacterium]